jgi:hypothetical protein
MSKNNPAKKPVVMDYRENSEAEAAIFLRHIILSACA